MFLYPTLSLLILSELDKILLILHKYSYYLGPPIPNHSYCALLISKAQFLYTKEYAK